MSEQDPLIQSCQSCGHLRGEHLVTAQGATSYCLIQDCHCTKFQERKKPQSERAWHTTYKRCS